MYFEEKMINVHYRNRPDEGFVPYSIDGLSQRIVELKRQLAEQRTAPGVAMIKLDAGLYVAADEIAQIKVNDHHLITVRMKNGVGHHVECDYGKSAYDTIDRLVKEVNAVWGR